jgi:hypothetical protein
MGELSKGALMNGKESKSRVLSVRVEWLFDHEARRRDDTARAEKVLPALQCAYDTPRIEVM